MRQSLRPHPAAPAPAIAIEVEAERAPPGLLALRFVVTGDVGAIALPAPAAPARADRLWERTCFEAFVRTPTQPAYFELNFSPSTQWAAYVFDGYRAGMAVLPEVAAGIEITAAEGRYDLAAVSRLPLEGPWLLGLSAVIEDRDGAKSYWALTHPPGQPDFHHADCFAASLPPA